jgi:prepilin peptidase CpaA
MHLNWWPILIVVLIAAGWDVYSRRIPNWLVLPFLAVGLVLSGMEHGLNGLGNSLAGMAVVAVTLGPICWLRGMGMGDLKLCAAIGVWIGPSQMLFALVMTGIAGGVLAVGYALYHGALGRSLDSTGGLIGNLWRRGSDEDRRKTLDHPGALSVPYAPAIAIGTIFAFLARQS